jgi:ABC-type amino acid transport system permease subunit
MDTYVGPISNSLFSMKQLEELDLSKNELEGITYYQYLSYYLISKYVYLSITYHITLLQEQFRNGCGL